MLIKSHTEANPDEQPYDGRFLFVTTGQAEELLNYHSAPIAQRRLSQILTFAACFFFSFSYHLRTRPQIISITQQIQVSEVPAMSGSPKTQGGEKKKKEKKNKETDAVFF